MAGRLFIGNLSYDVTEAELHTHFAAIGPLASLSLATDRTTGKPRGFAFVEFREQADATEAIRRLNTQLFKGRPLAVSEARARDAQAPSRAPRPAGPRSPAAVDTPHAPGRDVGPETLSRRRRPPTKRAAYPERGPKRPIYKRAAGPVRFRAADDDGDEDEERGAYGTRHRPETPEPDPA